MELYNDTFSKDVVVTLLPSKELFYVHSVVLENYGCFRTLLEEQGGRAAAERQTRSRLRRQSSHLSALGSIASSLVGVGEVDENGFALPLNMNCLPTSQQDRSDQGSSSSSSSLPPPPPTAPPRLTTRPRIDLEIEGVSPNILRAILHFMYMGHIPTTSASCFRSTPPPAAPSTTTPETEAEETAGPPSSSSEVASTFRSSLESTQNPSVPTSTPTTTSPFDFSWTELYDAAVRYQLVGLTRLARLVLISRLEPDSSVRELMTWAYQHDSLIPCYLSYIIENVHPDHFKEGSGELTTQPHSRVNSSHGISADKDGGSSTSMLWAYREKCPKFGEILLRIVQMLDERRPVMATL
jgi:hypothetical protein